MDIDLRVRSTGKPQRTPWAAFPQSEASFCPDGAASETVGFIIFGDKNSAAACEGERLADRSADDVN
ncbi:hypothetical protein GGQ68_000378 [Sagittula marina]|uniref:Uncharacterized protein n=1 Tax=Sagittula marina TaxID=943940 RepID=A0A7W6DJT8_9RHOB|nr:hypothetical protein [Sagittula marina]